MTKFDQQTATCQVFTYREGLLSAVGHDLKLKVGRFTIDVDPAAPRVEGRFDATSLVVVNAVSGFDERPSALGDTDKEKIRGQILIDVLDVGRYPEIVFTSTRVTQAGDGYHISGELNLHGSKKTIQFTTKKIGSNQRAEVTVHQPDFGIKPYRAMMGALKVRPDVIVRVEFAAPTA